MNSVHIEIHKIGQACSFPTARACCHYLRDQFSHLKAEFNVDMDPTDQFYPYLISYKTWNHNDPLAQEPTVEICRAFIAGRGEIWT